MPTKKPAKKRAPRTDWKARALHREEVIGVQNQIAKFREQKLAETTDSFRLERSRATFYETQCEAAAKARIEAVDKLAAAEKHNAILLAEREQAGYLIGESCVECGTKRAEKYLFYVCYSAKCLRACVNRLDPSRFRRLKSLAAKWSIEITCALAILAVFAVASWYALR